MAMFRSFGATRFTVRSPKRMQPRSTVSSPAIMRSSVVFPQPEGPRSVTNFRLGNVRVTLSRTRTLPKLLSIFSSATSMEWITSALHSTGTKPGDEMTLQGHEQDCHWDSHEHACRHQQSPIHMRSLEEQHDSDIERQIVERVKKYSSE